MGTLAHVSIFCFLASYLVTLGLEGVRLLKQTMINRVFMLGFGIAGLTAHTIYLVIRSQKTNLPPLLSSSQDWVLVLAWITVLFYLVLTAVDRNLLVGLFLLPLVLILIGSTYFISDSPNQIMDAEREWKLLHAALLVVGIAGVIMGIVLAMMYLFQHHRLKHKQTMKNGLKLPNLERLARMNWWAVILAVPTLTLGMATGVGLGWHSHQGESPISFSDPVIVGNTVGWLVMIVFFGWLLTTKRPTGKQVAWLTVWSCGFLLVTLIGFMVLSGKSLTTWHI
ncbi:MAG: cytochrome c biogenesis protein CcsA [Planctomycetaceae bacterium]|nr:cytochrome c biogenesis protein CcsA [Planctomycetaceae bacterium]